MTPVFKIDNTTLLTAVQLESSSEEVGQTLGSRGREDEASANARAGASNVSRIFSANWSEKDPWEDPGRVGRLS
jgi:hypothetical protein